MSYYHFIVEIITKKAKTYKYSLFGSFFIGFLTYFYSFVHKLPNLDDVAMTFFHGEVATNHGRWMLDVMNWIMPRYSMPWIYGIISIIILAIANCFVIKIFNIKNKYLQALLSGLLISFQAVVGTLSYMFLSYMYALSLLLSVISIHLFLKEGWKNKFFAIIIMAISMGFYQAYWAISVVFFMIILMKELLENRKHTHTILKDGIFYFLFICITAILYYTINTIIFAIFDIHFNEYYSNRENSDWPLSERLYWTFVNMISCMFYGTYGFVVTWLSKAIHWFYIVFISMGVLLPIIKSKKYWNALIAFILLCLFPIGINCLNIITPIGTHSLTLITFASIYVFIAVLIQHYNTKKWIYDIGLITFSLLLFNNILIANKSYLKQYLQYENAKSFYTGVMVNVEQTPGFDQNSKLALIGEAKNLINDMSDFTYDDITGISATSIVNTYSRLSFIKTYVGFTIPFASDEEIQEIKSSDIFSSMACYPYYGSVQKIGNTIVVKFSDEND